MSEYFLRLKHITLKRKYQTNKLKFVVAAS
jgi:hypothetical protein